MTLWTDATAPSLADVEALARAAFAGLPEPIRAAAGEVEFVVEDFAAEAVLDEMGVEDPFELSGLYEGVDRIRLSVFGAAPHLSRIHLFRRPILDEWAELADVSLGDLVGHVLIHEIGHHMGLSDADIEAIEARED